MHILNNRAMTIKYILYIHFWILKWRQVEIVVFSKPFDPRVNFFSPKDKTPFTFYSRLDGIYSQDLENRKKGYLHLSPLQDLEVDL